MRTPGSARLHAGRRLPICDRREARKRLGAPGRSTHGEGPPVTTQAPNIPLFSRPGRVAIMLVGLAGIGLPAHAEAAEKVTITHQGLTRMAPAAGGGARPPGTGMRAMKSRSGHTLRPGSRTAPARIGNQRLGIGSKDLRRLKARTATPETGPNPDAGRKAAIRTHKPARRAVKTIDRQPQSRAGRLVGRKPASEPTPASRVDVRPRNFLMPDP
jgi:hypothetical protein